MSRASDQIKNVPASVRARLANVAKRQGLDFGAVLRLYFLERFLYRISISPYRERFLLKGALLFFARADDAARPLTRPTKDIDLEALAMQPDLDALRGVFTVIVKVVVPEDGVVFDPDSMEIETIRDDDPYGGIRIHVVAHLERARNRVQIDVGFGDAVTPGPLALEYPTFVPGLPAPALKAYPWETVVAEKWETTVRFAEANSRLKDAIDLDDLAGREPFDGVELQRAVQRTFERRRTPLDATSVVMTEAFRTNAERQTLWSAALRRYSNTTAPVRLAEGMVRVIAFVGPPYLAAAEGRSFSGRWDPKQRTWVPSASFAQRRR